MRPTLRFNARVFTAFLIVGLAMLAAASYLVVGIGQARQRSASGEHLRQVADQAVAAVDAHVYRRIIDASVLARAAEVREAASAGSRSPFNREAALAIEREWQRAGTAPEAVRAVFAAPASSFLADVVRINTTYKEVIVTDLYGRLVAASGLPSDYLQSDEPWWVESFGDGVHGALTVGDVTYDESSKTWGIEISVPVEDPAGGRLAGILKAVADIRELGAVLGGVRMGATGEADLLREDGTFVYSLRPVDRGATFYAGDLLRERMSMAAREGISPLHFAALAPDGTRRVVGVAVSQLKASYPKLSWVVAVSQAEEELFGPVRAQGASLVIVLALTAVAVLLLALWFSSELARPPEPAEMDMHLVEHPPVHRIAD
ncbi:MAG: cache domain-containing protein [Vicinamibacterales bacterium]